MKKIWTRVLAVCLALWLLLSGCGVVDLQGWFQELRDLLGAREVAFSDMVYERPDLDALQRTAQAVEDLLSEKPTVEQLMEKVYAFYEQYHQFSTAYALADIYYCKNLTDIYWEEEYNYCLEATAQVDARLDKLLHTLAECPLRPELEHENYFGAGFFDNYQGESLWDEEFTQLMEQEAQLQSQYYDLSAQAMEVPYYSDRYFEIYGTQMAQLLVELVQVRKDIAQEAGYESYPEFAYDFYYDRDYTPAQAQTLLSEVEKELVPLYRQLAGSNVWAQGNQPSTEKETFAYVKASAQAMGGKISQAFSLMERAELYDISYGENKHDISFEVYLTTYQEPYVFVNPRGNSYDKLTFTHEFGHFCSDYASYGSVVGTDVAEIFSQGMEYLSLCYAEEAQSLEQLKMADCLSIYVEQAGYASFEQQLYAQDALTVQDVQALYAQVGQDFGFDVWNWDSRSFVCVTHFYTAPMYIISYVVSNDAAFQLYQAEMENPGQGLSLLEENLDTQEAQFLAFLKRAGLESPFEQGRLKKVKETLRGILVK